MSRTSIYPHTQKDSSDIYLIHTHIHTIHTESSDLYKYKYVIIYIQLDYVRINAIFVQNNLPTNQGIYNIVHIFFFNCALYQVLYIIYIFRLESHVTKFHHKH